MERSRFKRKKERQDSKNFGRAYILQLIFDIGISAIITIVFEFFLINNISVFANYMYKTDPASKTSEGFSTASTFSIILFVILGIIMFAVIFLFLQRKTARDIQKIAGGVQQISEGDLSTEIEVESEGELFSIAESINKMERDILDLIEKERESEKSKNDLITNVAHDLRTPLTSMLGYVELLMNNEKISPVMERKYLEIVYQKSKRLEKLIEELFGFTKLSYGKLNMNPKRIDIVSLLAQLLEENYPAFKKNDLSYELISNVKSLKINADPDLLARLFDNLISNAIKYGRDGKAVNVKIRARRRIVSIKVINYGYIIPKSELPMIFEKFYRVENSRSVKTGGTGLGLAIVKNIVDMHEGSIDVTSDYRGTVFTVQLKIDFDMESEF